MMGLQALDAGHCLSTALRSQGAFVSGGGCWRPGRQGRNKYVLFGVSTTFGQAAEEKNLVVGHLQHYPCWISYRHSMPMVMLLLFFLSLEVAGWRRDQMLLACRRE